MTSGDKWFGPGLQPIYTPLWLQLSCQQRQAAGLTPGGELASCSARGTGISQTPGRLDRRKEKGDHTFPQGGGVSPGDSQAVDTLARTGRNSEVGDSCNSVCRRKPCTPALDGDRCLRAVDARGVGRRES